MPNSCWFAVTWSPLRYPTLVPLDRHVSWRSRTAIGPRIPGIRFSHETERRNAFNAGKERLVAQHRRPCSDERAGSRRRNVPRGSALGSARPYGHWPLFTQPGAGCALTVGAANDVAIVTAGGSKVAVAPMLMSVGSTFMAGYRRGCVSASRRRVTRSPGHVVSRLTRISDAQPASHQNGAATDESRERLHADSSQLGLLTGH